MHITKAIRNAGKMLNMNIIAVNKISSKLKFCSFKIPHYALPDRTRYSANHYTIEPLYHYTIEPLYH